MQVESFVLKMPRYGQYRSFIDYKVDIAKFLLTFKTALEESNGLREHPKADALWKTVLDHADNYDLYEIEDLYVSFGALL